MTATEAITRANEILEAARNKGDDAIEETMSVAGRARHAAEDAAGHLPDLLENARSGAAQITDRVPGAVEQARVVANETETRLQKLPDATLKLLAAGSVGLAAGIMLARRSRLVALVAVLPALVIGSAIATRKEPTEPRI
jgi:ElaB/YqjD/DUF883 family membrane-anchored ribosome-binding protein